jgi:hypothetical protein
VTAEARARPALSTLDRAVVAAVAYSDVFDFAVTAQEIQRVLPRPVSVAEVEASLELLPDFVACTEAFYTLVGREALAETRLRRAEASRRLMLRAERYGCLIALLPFVRMVAVTGSLAVENADDGDDIDYLIVTAPGRVWLARAQTMAVVRVAALRGVTLCPNYLLDQDALALPERDAYTARELLQMRPLAGHDVYSRMLEVNPWWFDLLPNWRPDPRDEKRARGFLQRLGESALGGRMGDALERWLLRRKGAELRARAGGNAEAVFDAMVCKGHFDAHRARLESALAERLARLGVQP